MPLQNVTVKWQQGTEEVTTQVGYNFEGARILDVPLGAGSVNTQINFTFSRTLGKVLFLLSDVAMTVKTNNSGAPADTINLAAGKPFLWTHDWGLAVPLTADITALFVSVPGGTGGTLKIRSLEDATP